MEREESREEVITIHQSNENTIREPDNDTLKDLRQVFRSLNARTNVNTEDITKINIPKEKQGKGLFGNSKLYEIDTANIKSLYSVDKLNMTIDEIKSKNLTHFKQLDRISMRAISTRSMDNYIENLTQSNLNIKKLGKKNQIPEYLKLANTVNISTLRELHKINKFNTFYNKSYIIEQAEYSRKQNIQTNTLLGTINNLSKTLDRKLEAIKINTSIPDIRKSTVWDIQLHNFKTKLANKIAQAGDKALGYAGSAIKSGFGAIFGKDDKKGKDAFTKSMKELGLQIVKDIKENVFNIGKLTKHIDDFSENENTGGALDKESKTNLETTANELIKIREILEIKFGLSSSMLPSNNDGPKNTGPQPLLNEFGKPFKPTSEGKSATGDFLNKGKEYLGNIKEGLEFGTKSDNAYVAGTSQGLLNAGSAIKDVGGGIKNIVTGDGISKAYKASIDKAIEFKNDASKDGILFASGKQVGKLTDITKNAVNESMEKLGINNEEDPNVEQLEELNETIEESKELDEDRNTTLDKIKEGINKVADYLKPKKKDIKDRDSDGDDDGSYYDKDKEKDINENVDTSIEEKEEDESRSLLSKIGKFMGPISSILGGLVTTATSAISGIGSTIFKLLGAILGYSGLKSLLTKAVPALGGVLGGTAAAAGAASGAAAAGTAATATKTPWWKRTLKGTWKLGKGILGTKFGKGAALVGGAVGANALLSGKASAEEVPLENDGTFDNLNNVDELLAQLGITNPEKNNEPTKENLSGMAQEVDDQTQSYTEPSELTLTEKATHTGLAIGTVGTISDIIRNPNIVQSAKTSLDTIKNVSPTILNTTKTIPSTLSNNANKAALKEAAKKTIPTIGKGAWQGGKLLFATTGKFLPILGWAFLAYDVYRYGGMIIRYFRERDYNLKNYIYTPISIIYSEEGPKIIEKTTYSHEENQVGSKGLPNLSKSSQSKNEEIVFTDSFLLRAEAIFETQYEIIYNAIKPIGERILTGIRDSTYENIGVDINEYKNNFESIASYNFSGNLVNRGMKKYKKYLVKTLNIKSEDVNKYVDKEIDKIKKKNKLFLKFLSQTTNGIYIQRLEKMAMGWSYVEFRELLMAMFMDEEFLTYLQANENLLKKIGPIFNKNDIEKLKEGTLNLTKENKTELPSVEFSDSSDPEDKSEMSEEKESSSTFSNFISNKLGEGMMDTIKTLFDSIWGKNNQQNKKRLSGNTSSQLSTSDYERASTSANKIGSKGIPNIVDPGPIATAISHTKEREDLKALLNPENITMQRIHMHWTAGGHKPNIDYDLKSYHFVVDGSSKIHHGKHKVKNNYVPSGQKLSKPYAAHTLNANSNAIGVSLCAMAGAQERPFKAGNAPIKKEQYNTFCKLIADLCYIFNVPLTNRTVLTHAEVEPVLGKAQNQKWDIMVLPFDKEWGSNVKDPIVVGNKIRKDIEKYSSNGSTFMTDEEKMVDSRENQLEGLDINEPDEPNESGVIKDTESYGSTSSSNNIITNIFNNIFGKNKNTDLGGPNAQLSSLGNVGSSTPRQHNTISLPEDISNATGYEGMPTNNKGQVITNFDIPGIKRSGNHVSLQHLTENTKTCLIRLVRLFGREIVCNSAFRTPMYNNSLKGAAKKSQHIKGTAVDISTRGMSNNDKAFLLECALKSGFSSIGFYDTFLHFDRRKYGTTWGKRPSWAKTTMASLWSQGMSPGVEEQVAEANEPSDNEKSTKQTTPSTDSNTNNQQVPSTSPNKPKSTNPRQQLSSVDTDTSTTGGYFSNKFANRETDQTSLPEGSYQTANVGVMSDAMGGSSWDQFIKNTMPEQTNTTFNVEAIERDEFNELDISDTTAVSDEQLQIQLDHYKNNILVQMKNDYKKAKENNNQIKIDRFTYVRDVLNDEMKEIRNEQRKRQQNNTTNQNKTSLKGLKKPIDLNVNNLSTTNKLSATYISGMNEEELENNKNMYKEKLNKIEEQYKSGWLDKTSYENRKKILETNIYNIEEEEFVRNDEKNSTYKLPTIDAFGGTGQNVNITKPESDPKKKLINYIQDLNDKVSRGEISDEEYRRKKERATITLQDIRWQESIKSQEAENRRFTIPEYDLRDKQFSDMSFRDINEETGRLIEQRKGLRKDFKDDGSNLPLGQKILNISDKHTNLSYERHLRGNFDDVKLRHRDVHEVASEENLSETGKLKKKLRMARYPERNEIKRQVARDTLNRWKDEDENKDYKVQPRDLPNLENIDEFDPRNEVPYNNIFNINTDSKDSRPSINPVNAYQPTIDDENRPIIPKENNINDAIKEAMNYELDPDAFDPRSSTAHKTSIEPRFPKITFRDINKETGRLREKSKELRKDLNKDKNNVSLGYEILDTDEQRRDLAYERHFRGNFDDVKLRHRDVHGVASEEDLSETNKLTRKLKLQNLEKRNKFSTQLARDNINKIDKLKGEEDYKVQPRDLPNFENIDEFDPRNQGSRDGAFNVEIDSDKHDPRKDTFNKAVTAKMPDIDKDINLKKDNTPKTQIDKDTGEETYPSTTDPETTSSPPMKSNIGNDRTRTDIVPTSTRDITPVDGTVMDPMPSSNPEFPIEALCKCISSVESAVKELSSLITTKGIKISNFKELKENENKESSMSVEIKNDEVFMDILTELKMYNETGKKLIDQTTSKSNIRHVNPNLDRNLNTSQKPQSTLFNNNVTSI